MDDRAYAIKPDVVDRVLGAGIYATWHDVQERFIEEQSRAYTNETRYSQTWATPLKKQLQADLAFADKVCVDYLAFLERTTASQTANLAEGERILAVFILAISILNSVNDLLDEITDLGIVSLIAAFNGAMLEREAMALQRLLVRLQQELEKAKREVREAWAQTVFNAAVTVSLACSGPLGWLAIGGIGLGQMIADVYLGPSTSDAATWSSQANTTLGSAVSAAPNYLDKTSKALTVLKPVGKAIIVVGFVFDANELALGYRNIDGLKKLMAEAKKAHGQLIEKIRFHRATYAGLMVMFNELHRKVVGRNDGWTAGIRQTLEYETQRTGYRPRL